MEQRKNAVDLTELALGIVVLGIVVTIGAVILTTMRDTRLTDLDTSVTANESISPTDAGVALTKTWVKSVDFCTNGSEADGAVETLTTENYTVSINAGNGYATIYNESEVYANPTSNPWNCTYTTYNTSRADWALADEAATGLAEYGNWFKIIVIVGVAAVVLSLIFLAFGRRSGTDVGGTY